MQSGVWDAAEIVVPLDLICSKAALRSSAMCAHVHTDKLTLNPSV